MVRLISGSIGNLPQVPVFFFIEKPDNKYADHSYKQGQENCPRIEDCIQQNSYKGPSTFAEDVFPNRVLQKRLSIYLQQKERQKLLCKPII